MDTISRENNSPLPLAGLAIGIVALIIGGYAAINVVKVRGIVNGQADKVARIDDIATQVQSAQSASDKAARDITSLASQTQTAVTQIANDLAAIHEQVKHLEESHVAKAAKGPKGEPAVAGPGEYIVKSGDTGSKIARANGCTLADLESVNSGVSWTHLKVGEKLKLPEKK
ncbi:MAG TPA: LysM domain-containing protein [Opitutaceae bacterium]|nr:LysM domain-containing protein [Opitutaceae bacterium]